MRKFFAKRMYRSIILVFGMGIYFFLLLNHAPFWADITEWMAVIFGIIATYSTDSKVN